MIDSLPVMVVLITTLTLSGSIHAAVFQCPAGDVGCLIETIHTANGNGEDDTIQLEPGIYVLTAVGNETDGPNGLPSITSPITITGAGVNTTIIERDVSAPPFRFLHIAAAGTLTLEGLTLRGGKVSAPGGSLLNNGGTVTLSSSALLGNSASHGGALLNDGGTITITHSILSGNRAHLIGGAIYNVGLMNIAHSTLANNVAEVDYGGGIANNTGSVIITHSTLVGNSTSGGDGGGGITNTASATIINSTLAGNSAGFGGGIDTQSSGELTIINSTLANNAAMFGGGINAGGRLTIINTTLAGNAASLTGGGINATPSLELLELQNTILALNTVSSSDGSPDCSQHNPPTPPLTSLGNNLVGDTAGCPITLLPSDLTGNPGLGNFTDDTIPGHGYVPLLASSRAINAANDAVCPETDQLGQPRVGICDIGAIEFPQEIELVNGLVTFVPLRTTFRFTPDHTGCPEEFVGKFSFIARLTNASDHLLSNLFIEVTTLTNGNLLQNADGGPGGVGARLTVPQEDDFTEGILSSDEFVDVPFIICLTERRPFTFMVDVLGVVDANADTQAGARPVQERRVRVAAGPHE